MRSRTPASRRVGPLLGAGLALVALVAAACTGGSEGGAPLPPTSEASIEVAAAEPIRIMPLGDSLTEGGDPLQPTNSPQSYRGFLFSLLEDAGHDVDFVGSNSGVTAGGSDADHEGHGGFTIGPDESELCTGCGPANLAANVEGWLAAAQPEVVLLMIGVNDMLPERDVQPSGFVRPVQPADAATKLAGLVELIRAEAPDAIVLVASYPPITFLVDPALGNASPFAALNESARSLGSGADPDVVYVPVVEELAEDWTASDVLANGDQLHPSAQGAAKIARVFFETLDPVLRDLEAGR
ncbi:MAG: GDSL-type esterase/lipase family protein [Acidimicrobiia bacterium]|nr:GDSL-type esterase/lipase family protein [Acidimicrobiia bacterium]